MICTVTVDAINLYATSTTKNNKQTKTTFKWQCFDFYTAGLTFILFSTLICCRIVCYFSYYLNIWVNLEGRFNFQYYRNDSAFVRARPNIYAPIFLRYRIHKLFSQQKLLQRQAKLYRQALVYIVTNKVPLFLRNSNFEYIK